MHLFKNVVIIPFFVLIVYSQGEIPGVKSIKKCNEYWSTNRYTNITPLNDIHLDYILKIESGYYRREIIGYRNKPNGLSFMAALGYGNNTEKQYLCGGSLISPEFVLTVAHCLFDEDLNPVTYVRLGDLNLTSAEDDQWVQELKVKDRFQYPKYKKSEHYHDIALLKLNKPAVVSKNVYPICLSPEFVITAAHCLYAGASGPVTYVRLGDSNLTSAEDDEWIQELEVKEFFPHPKYKYPKKYHDIALLKLNKPAVLNKHVNAICLEHQRTAIIRFSTLYAAGWGALGYGEAPSNRLLLVELFHFFLKTCRQVYNASYEIPQGIIDSLQMCAGGLEKVADTCVGDSGGPLLYIDYGFIPRILGITSFGKECGTLGVPAVYTRVSNYIEWIESIVWPDNN